MEGGIYDSLIYDICDVRTEWKRKKNTCHHAVGSATYGICGGLTLVGSQMPTQPLANYSHPTRQG